MSVKAGDEVLAYCGSCKMDLNSVIVALSGAKIARVQCRTCKGERAYKAPKGILEPGATATATKTTRSRAPKAEPVDTAIAVREEWTNKMKEAAANPKVEYAISKSFRTGEIVKHPSFGDGVVTKTIHPDKIEVIFENDLKILLHGRV